MKFLLTFILSISMNSMLVAQENYYSVVAENGDGIFSILRKQGLDPVKYYEVFINLNEQDIKDGSLLHVGREYKIPIAKDSYKNKGLLVKEEGDEEPIFDSELAKMSHQNNTLENAVYYLIAEDSSKTQNKFVGDITKNLAAKLLEQGATVFIMGENEKNTMAIDTSLTAMDKIGGYVGTINEHFLRNQGKYQRLLVIRSNGVMRAGNLDVSVFHHNNSDQGQRLSENLQYVFKKHSVVKSNLNNCEAFEDKNTLFLAKNALPAVSLITIDNRSKVGGENVIPVRSDKRVFANWITDGILKDYAELTIEE